MLILAGCINAALTITRDCPAQATTAKPPEVDTPYQPPRTRDAAGLCTGPGRRGWWNDAVFYQVFIRSFADNADPQRDRTGPGAAGDGIGDIPGLIDRLDYLNDGDPATTSDLGINALWLMPVMESPSYHGYDTVNLTTIERDYGSNADFRRLVEECHKRGIRVVIDLVLNHLSRQHPWFQKARIRGNPEREWFIFEDNDPGWTGPWGQKVWHSAAFPRALPSPGETDSYYYGLFGPHMPDLNYRSGELSMKMLDAAEFWLREPTSDSPGMGVDGFRLDAIRHLIEDGRRQDNTTLTHEWLCDFYSFYKSINPEAMCVGEVWASTETAASYVGDQMDLAFDFDLAEAMIRAANSGDAAVIRAAQDRTLRAFPPNQYGRFLSNHDQTRVMTRLKSDPGKMRSAAAMLLLGPGVPFIYYAEELGMPGDKPDERLRTPMPWDSSPAAGFTTAVPWQALQPGHETINVRSESGDPASLLNLYRALIRVRTANPSILHGQYGTLESSSPGVYAFLRWSADAESGVPLDTPAPVIVAVNLTAQPIAEVSISADTSPLRGDYAAADLLPFDSPVPAPAAITADSSAASAPGRVSPFAVALPPHGARAFLLRRR